MSSVSTDYDSFTVIIKHLGRENHQLRGETSYLMERQHLERCHRSCGKGGNPDMILDWSKKKFAHIVGLRCSVMVLNPNVALW